MVVAIFPDGRIIKDVCIIELAKELEISEQLIRKILRIKEPYKAPSKCNPKISEEQLEHLKTLEGMIIMTQENYLKEQSQQNN